MITLHSKFSVMGILNVTPDSFSDGGRYYSPAIAIAQGLRLVDQGADIIDIGGASSRPGANVVSIDEECRRVLPVIEKIAKVFKGPISIDTTWSEVAKRSLECGATWINDISAGRFDADMKLLASQKKCPVILMHSRGTPDSLHDSPHYDTIIDEVKRELMDAVDNFIQAGVDKNNIILDPGIGFAKSKEHNIALMQHLDQFTNLGYPVLLGTSRKSFIGALTAKPVDQRVYGSLATVASGCLRGVNIFRVHDVGATKDFLKVFQSIEYPEFVR